MFTIKLVKGFIIFITENFEITSRIHDVDMRVLGIHYNLIHRYRILQAGPYEKCPGSSLTYDKLLSLILNII